MATATRFGAYQGLVNWANPTYRSVMQGARNARTAASSKAGGASGDLFDNEGLPTRLPGSPEEALQFQFAASNWARRKNEQMLANAQATMRYGLGMINKFGPYSAATMMNPLLGQMGQNYMNMQYDQPDYSYFMRSGRAGGGGGGGGFVPSGAQASPSEHPVQMRWPQEKPAAAPAQAGGTPWTFNPLNVGNVFGLPAGPMGKASMAYPLQQTEPYGGAGSLLDDYFGAQTAMAAPVAAAQEPVFDMQGPNYPYTQPAGGLFDEDFGW